MSVGSQAHIADPTPGFIHFSAICALCPVEGSPGSRRPRAGRLGGPSPDLRGTRVPQGRTVTPEADADPGPDSSPDTRFADWSNLRIPSLSKEGTCVSWLVGTET